MENSEFILVTLLMTHVDNELQLLYHQQPAPTLSFVDLNFNKLTVCIVEHPTNNDLLFLVVVCPRGSDEVEL